MGNFFDKLNDWINNTEGSLVNFLSAFAPWLAPLIPAYMTWFHMIDFLKFDAWLAWILAAVVEILGFSTVSTGLDFWFYNRRDKAKKRQAPLTLVFISFGFYLSLIIMSNVMIDWAIKFGTVSQQDWVEIAVRFLLTLQTLPAALIVAARTGHRDLLNTLKQEKLDAKVSESFTKVSESFEDGAEGFRPDVLNFPRDWRKLRPTLSDSDMVRLSKATSDEIRKLAERHGVTERTVENWKRNAQDELGE